MHTIFIDGQPVRSAQEIANAVAFVPEQVRIESGSEISMDSYDGALLDLKPRSHVLFRTVDGVIGELHVGAQGERTVGVMRDMRKMSGSAQTDMAARRIG